MATGTIVRWNADRAFGFIKNDDGGPDVFLHIAHIEGVPVLGDRVEFEVAQTHKGIQARDARPLICGEVDETNWAEYIGTPPLKDLP